MKEWGLPLKMPHKRETRHAPKKKRRKQKATSASFNSKTARAAKEKSPWSKDAHCLSANALAIRRQFDEEDMK